MTRDDLKEAFNVYTEQIPRLKETKAHWALIHYLVIFPDICGALESDKGEASGSSYKSWAKRYLEDAMLSAEEWYDIRCRLLHQGITLGRKRYLNYVFRSPDHGGKTRHKEVIKGVIILDATRLASEVQQALERWYADVETRKDESKARNVGKNIPRLACSPAMGQVSLIPFDTAQPSDSGRLDVVRVTTTTIDTSIIEVTGSSPAGSVGQTVQIQPKKT